MPDERESHSSSNSKQSDPKSSDFFLERLVSRLSHELFGPIEAIINNMETMSEAITPAQRDMLASSTHYAASKLHLTLSLIVDLCDLESSKFEPQSEHFAIWALLSEASLMVQSHYPALRPESIKLTMDQDALVLADRDRLLRIVSSLGSLLVSLLPYDAGLKISAIVLGTQPNLDALQVSLSFDQSVLDQLTIEALLDDPQTSSSLDSHVVLGVLHARRLLSHVGGSIHFDYTVGSLSITFPAHFIRHKDIEIEGSDRSNHPDRPLRVAFYSETHPLDSAFFDHSSTTGIDFRPFPSPQALVETIEEEGSDVILLRQTTTDVSFLQAAKAIRSTQVGRQIPILLVCREPSLQSFRFARRFVDVVLGEPCSMDTVVGYLVGMASADRRRRPRLVEFRSAPD